MFTASSSYRVEKCAASAMPGGVHETGEYAEQGNAIHAFFDLAKINGRDYALDQFKTSEYYREMSKIPVDDFLSDATAIATEVSFGINVFTREARYLGHHLGRNYPNLGDGWIVGSEDIVATCRNDGFPIVADLKTGDDVGSVIENLQIGFFALAIYLLTERSYVHGRILYTRDNREVVDVFSLMDLDVVYERLRATYIGYQNALKEYNEGKQLPVYPGDWCRYCKHFDSCPKWVGLIKSFLPELEYNQFNHNSLTLDKIAEIWPKFKQMKNYFVEMDDRVKEMVRRHNGIPLKNGKKLAMVPSSREYIDGKKAVKMLRDWGATEEQIEDLFRVSRFERMQEIKDK